MEEDICVVCKSRMLIERGGTIRWYYADTLCDPKLRTLIGKVCSLCKNKDYDKYLRGRSRMKPLPPTDPFQTKLM